MVQFVELQKTFADSENSWTVKIKDVDQTTFDLTSKESELLGSQTTPILISYHLSEQHAIDNIPIPNPSMYPNISNPQTIYVRAQFDPNNNMMIN